MQLNPTPSLPDSIIDSSDPGDETLKRFRYQITYSCIASLTMLDHPEIKEVFCEHFEDILIKLSTGKYVGIQVKTKDLSLGPFECTDEAMVGSIVKFVNLHLQFPGIFEKFVIVTNNDFSKAKPGKDLRVFVKTCKDGFGSKLLSSRSASKVWVNKIAKTCRCKDQNIIDVLALVELKHHSSIDDIRKTLIQNLRTDKRLTTFTYGQLEGLAQKFIMMHFDAASLNQENVTSDYLSCGPQELSVQQKINGKKITIDILNQLINEAVVSPISLFLKDRLMIGEIPQGYQKLEIKMDAGKVSSENILLFKDNKFSVENLLASWLFKDTDQAEKKYNQFRLIVHNECQAVYDNMLIKGNDFFGMEMLSEVRTRLRERFREDSSSFYDCKFEHLLGMAGILTEECKLWWSTKFQILS